MKKRLLLATQLICCITTPIVSFVTLVPTVHAKTTILPAPQKVSTHVYAWIGPYGGPNKKNNGFRMNLGFIIGSKSVAIVDTGYTPAMAREMVQHIRKISTLPIKYAINTNSQPHRYFGNDIFKQLGADIISTTSEAARMQQRGGDFSGAIERNLELTAGKITPPAPPSTQIEKTMELNLGDIDIILQPVGANHTPGSLVVVIPADQVVFAGDVLYSGRLLAVQPDSNVKGWIQAYQNLRQHTSFTFIPGHGKPAKLDAFAFPTLQYLTSLHKHMAQALENDVSIDDAMASLDQSAYSKLENFKDLAGRNASWTYILLEQQTFE